MYSDGLLKAIWSPVSGFGTKFEAYKEIIAKQAEEKAAAAAAEAAAPSGKGGTAAAGSKAAKGGPADASPADFESTLPVASKYTLEAALRGVATLAQQGGPAIAWLCANADMEHLIRLLSHHSPLVQERRGEGGVRGVSSSPSAPTLSDEGSQVRQSPVLPPAAARGYGHQGHGGASVPARDHSHEWGY